MAAVNALMNRTYSMAAPQCLRTRISDDLQSGVHVLVPLTFSRLDVVPITDIPLMLFGAWHIETTGLAAAAAFLVRPPIGPLDWIHRSKSKFV